MIVKSWVCLSRLSVSSFPVTPSASTATEEVKHLPRPVFPHLCHSRINYPPDSCLPSEHTRCRCKRFTGEVWLPEVRQSHHKCPVPPQIPPCKGTTALCHLLSCYEALWCTGAALRNKMFLLTRLKSLLRTSTQIPELVQTPLLSHIT